MVKACGKSEYSESKSFPTVCRLSYQVAFVFPIEMFLCYQWHVQRGAFGAETTCKF